MKFGPAAAELVDEGRSDAYVKERLDELEGLRYALVELMNYVALVREPVQDGPVRVTLAPDSEQRRASFRLRVQYQEWREHVLPFLERVDEPLAKTLEDLATETDSYFALARVGHDIPDELWRELFASELDRLIHAQGELIRKCMNHFRVLDPRPAKKVVRLPVRVVQVGSNEFEISCSTTLGDGRAVSEFLYDERDIEIFKLRHCGAGRGGGRGWAPVSVKPYAEFGKGLFDFLFGDPAVRDVYARHLVEANESASFLRIELDLVAAPTLWGTPWEFLFDGNDFSLLDGRRTLTRAVYSTASRTRPETTGALRILVTVSSPNGLPPLDVDRECKRLVQAVGPLAKAGFVEIQFSADGSVNGLQRALRFADQAARPFHAWHFIGHGGVDVNEDASWLAFEGDQKEMTQTTGFELGSLFAAHQELEFAVLNACDGAVGGSGQAASNVAAALIEKGLEAVVAMQFPISDDAAICFSGVLYEEIVTGVPVDWAVGQARRALYFKPSLGEWATPTVLIRPVAAS